MNKALQENDFNESNYIIVKILRSVTAHVEITQCSFSSRSTVNNEDYSVLSRMIFI